LPRLSLRAEGVEEAAAGAGWRFRRGDSALDQEITGGADEEEVFGIVTPHQDEPMPGVHDGNLDHGQSRRSAAAFPAEGRRNPNGAQAEAAQQKCQ
jgi:hypothetical protein